MTGFEQEPVVNLLYQLTEAEWTQLQHCITIIDNPNSEIHQRTRDYWMRKLNTVYAKAKQQTRINATFTDTEISTIQQVYSELRSEIFRLSTRKEQSP